MENRPIEPVWDGNNNFTILDDFRLMFDALAKKLKFTNILHLKEKRARIFFEYYKNCRKTLKFNQPKRLIPILMYMVLKENGYIVKKNNFIANSDLSKKDFHEAYKRALTIYPDFQRRDKKIIILKMIAASALNCDELKILHSYNRIYKYADKRIKNDFLAIMNLFNEFGFDERASDLSELIRNFMRQARKFFAYQSQSDYPMRTLEKTVQNN